MTNPFLKKLVNGNIRFVSGTSTMDISKARRDKLIYKQKPFAGIIGCVDSRVPPEIIFDAGIGELLVVRTAGAILDNAAIGSLVYGVAELKIPLLMVLGHRRCGAIKVAMEVMDGSIKVDSEMKHIVKAVKPSIEKAKNINGDFWNNATKMHIQSVREQLAQVPVLSNARQNGILEIVGGFYDLETGVVEIL